MEVPDMDESSVQSRDELDSGSAGSSPRPLSETPITAAPLREPVTHADSTFEPKDFVEFLLATDALLGPEDAHADPAGTRYVQALLGDAVRSDAAALTRFSKDE